MKYWIKYIKYTEGKRLMHSLKISPALQEVMNFLAVKSRVDTVIEGTKVIRYQMPRELGMRISKAGHLLFSKDLIRHGECNVDNSIDYSDIKKQAAVCISFVKDYKQVITKHRAKQVK